MSDSTAKPTPHLFSKKEFLNGLAKAWHKQYYIDAGHRWQSGWLRDTHMAIEALHGDEQRLMELLGKDSAWFDDLRCMQCGQMKDPMVVVGEPLITASYSARVCKDCLLAALQLLDGGGTTT